MSDLTRQAYMKAYYAARMKHVSEVRCGVPVWVRECPSCFVEIVHTSANSCYMAVRMDRKCAKCRYHGTGNPAKEIPERTYLESLYLSMSASKIGNLLGASDCTVSKWLRAYGIPVRTIGQGVSKAQIGAKHSDEWNRNIGLSNKGKHGATPERRKQLRDLAVKKFSDPLYRPPIVANRHRSSGIAGHRSDLGFSLRSRWEANYARFLNTCLESGSIVRWEYEWKRFRFPSQPSGRQSYLPDFAIWANTKEGEPDEYREIKGVFDARSKQASDLMALHYPDVKVCLVDEKEYRRMESWFGPVIKNWERSGYIPKRDRLAA